MPRRQILLPGLGSQPGEIAVEAGTRASTPSSSSPIGHAITTALARDTDPDEAARLFRLVTELAAPDDEYHQKARARINELEQR